MVVDIIVIKSLLFAKSKFKLPNQTFEILNCLKSLKDVVNQVSDTLNIDSIQQKRLT